MKSYIQVKHNKQKKFITYLNNTGDAIPRLTHLYFVQERDLKPLNNQIWSFNCSTRPKKTLFFLIILYISLSQISVFLGGLSHKRNKVNSENSKVKAEDKGPLFKQSRASFQRSFIFVLWICGRRIMCGKFQWLWLGFLVGSPHNHFIAYPILFS